MGLYKMAQNVDQKYYRELCKSCSITPPEEKQRLENLLILQRQRSFWECELCLYTVNFMHELRNLKPSVQIMYGLEDVYYPVEDGIEMKEAIGKNTELICLPNCNNFAHLENPELVSKKVMQFV